MKSGNGLARSQRPAKFLLSGTLAALAFASTAASATTVAYASRLLGGGLDYLRIDLNGHSETIGSIEILPSAGAFAGDDYSTQYVLDWTVGRMYAMDVRAPQTLFIGATHTGDNLPIGLHWDPTSSQMYLIANDEACTTTTLYVVDITDASTFEIGSTPRCIISLAIDANGNGFGIDENEDSLVSMDIGTGVATTIGPLGFDTSALDGGLDFDPSTGELNLFAGAGRYLVDTEQGTATLVTTYNFVPLGVALALLPDALFSNGFDPEGKATIAASGWVGVAAERHP